MVNIACVNSYREKWNIIIDIDFLREIKNGIILNGLLLYVNFISSWVKRLKMYIVCATLKIKRVEVVASTNKFRSCIKAVIGQEDGPTE